MASYKLEDSHRKTFTWNITCGRKAQPALHGLLVLCLGPQWQVLAASQDRGTEVASDLFGTSGSHSIKNGTLARRLRWVSKGRIPEVECKASVGRPSNTSQASGEL